MDYSELIITLTLSDMDRPLIAYKSSPEAERKIVRYRPFGIFSVVIQHCGEHVLVTDAPYKP